ncbi:MAG: ATP phosphoribosyltransferase [Hyphomicrobiales bacterium]|nr:ATP phosphoribosyltransferase [Hyphomicrobiales bacterium]
MSSLLLALPSKGRLHDQMNKFFDSSGLKLSRSGGKRTYSGFIEGIEKIEILYLSASEISGELLKGNIHMGITGIDLIEESRTSASKEVIMLSKLGFGKANVVIAVPNSWIDVENIKDLSEVASEFRSYNNRRMRVATKFKNITRNFFLNNGISNYRLVDSAGATEGSPAAGTSEIIVDITETGQTIEANNLKILNDGVMLESQSCIFSTPSDIWDGIDLGPVEKFLRIISARSEAINKAELFFDYTYDINDLEVNLFRKFNANFSKGSPELGEAITLIVPLSKVTSCSLYLTSLGYGPIRTSQPNFIYNKESISWNILKQSIEKA